MIAAAGSGERLGAGGPKAFVEAYGRPLLEWSLIAFDAAETIGAAAPDVIADRADARDRRLDVGRGPGQDAG